MLVVLFCFFSEVNEKNYSYIELYKALIGQI